MAVQNVWLNKIKHTEPQDSTQLRERAVAVLKDIYDPELPVNVYDLGLIYEVDANTDGAVDVQMTLTTPACPVAQTFPSTIETRLMEEVEGITSAKVELVWDPPWTVDRLTDEVKLELGLL